MGQDPRAPRYSPDGLWWWDGTAWRQVAAPPAPRRSGGISSGAIVAFVAGAVAVLLVTVAVLSYLAFRRINDSLTNAPAVAASSIPCDQLEHTQVHYHAALQILLDGSALPIPTDLGRTRYCYYWLHMHTGEPGMIHLEAPLDRSFTLGDFFGVWASWSGKKELLDRRHVSTITLDSTQELTVYVDEGHGPTVHTGDPAAVVLKEREVITLEVTPPAVYPPPTFTWPPGF
jgi:hypothetical protein